MSVPSLTVAKLEYNRKDIHEGSEMIMELNHSAYFQFIHFGLLLLTILSFTLNMNHYRKLRNTFESINKKYDLKENG